MGKNIQKMQAIHGELHFDFIPKTYILPTDHIDLVQEMEKNKD